MRAARRNWRRRCERAEHVCLDVSGLDEMVEAARRSVLDLLEVRIALDGLSHALRTINAVFESRSGVTLH